MPSRRRVDSVGVNGSGSTLVADAESSMPSTLACRQQTEISAHRSTRRICGTSVRWLCTALCFLLQLAASAADQKSLYAPGDNVLELDVTNFDSTVYHQPRGFFVEFYSSWCGHCIHYKPTYVQFATLLKSWKGVVQVSVINCADEKNSPVCREHEIDAFPTLKYFKYNSQGKQDGQRYDGDKYNIDSMTLDVVKLAMGDYAREHPPFWPKLEITPNSVTLNDLWTTTDVAINLLAVVVEHEPAHNGLATMINYADDKHVRVVIVAPTHPVAQQFGGVVVPALHVFKREQPALAAYSSSTEAKFQDIKKEIDTLISAAAAPSLQVAAPVVPVAQAAAAAPTIGKEPAVPVDWKQYEVQYLDLISALYYMATQEIPRKQVIDGTHLTALKGWVHLLKRFVPLSAPVRRLFFRLDDWVAKQPVQIRAEEWLSKFEEIQSELGHPLPSNTTWQSCRGSKPYLRGYTCGLWTLFHAITVEAYKENKLDPRFRPLDEVLEPIHQFIINYLSCEICRQNFDKMTKNNKLTDVSKPEDVVLWLWRAHNNVNQRLSGDASEDPKFPKRQFPPTSVCPDCQSNGVYLENKILEFMIRYYSDVRVDNVRPEPEYRVHEFENGKLQKVADKRLNPKFAAMSGKVDKLEEAEARLKDAAGPKRSWQRINSDDFGAAVDPPVADRRTFYFIWLLVIAAALGFAYMKYRQNRSKFWKTFYYHDYKL